MDRSFRDVAAKFEALGYDVKMPGLLGNDDKQLLHMMQMNHVWSQKPDGLPNLSMLYLKNRDFFLNVLINHFCLTSENSFVFLLLV